MISAGKTAAAVELVVVFVVAFVAGTVPADGAVLAVAPLPPPAAADVADDDDVALADGLEDQAAEAGQEKLAPPARESRQKEQ